MNAATPAKNVWPSINYRDARAGIRFLESAFGFQATAVYPPDGDGPVEHAQLDWPEGGGVMLGSADRGTEFSDRATGTASVYVVTDEPDRLYGRATAAGASVVREMRDEDYGSRGFSVRDPEGNIWSFGTYRGEPAAAAVEGATAAS